MTGGNLPKEPCPSCPYRTDTPSGVWTREHYERLADYDRPTWAQPRGSFMCHQQNGCFCGGWLTAHDASELLAVRLETSRETMPLEAFEYSASHNVECYRSGTEARDAGLAEIEEPSAEARALIAKLHRQKTKIPRGLGPSLCK